MKGRFFENLLWGIFICVKNLIQPLDSKFFNSSFSPNYSCTPIPMGIIQSLLVTPQYLAAAEVE